MAKEWTNRMLAVLMLAFLTQTATADESSDKAKVLIEHGQSKEAYQLLEPLEASRAGDPVFDLLFGIAAVDVGQNTRGVFALERVLALQPDNARARVEIGRAYLALGEHRRARASSRFQKGFRIRLIACWPSSSALKTARAHAGKAILRVVSGQIATSTVPPLRGLRQYPAWVLVFSTPRVRSVATISG